MALTVEDLADLNRLLIEHPEWLRELRRIVLTEELLSLPEVVRALAEAQRRTEERLEQLAARVDQLAEAQRRTEERLEQLAARLDQLAARVDQLAARVDQLAAQVERLVFSTQKLENEMSRVRGYLIEARYRDNPPAFFGVWLRKPRVVSLSDIWDTLESRLSDEEIRQLLPLDVLIKGRLPRHHQPQSDGEVWLAVEVSSVIDANDVERAVRRAALLRKAGLVTVPVVSGQEMVRDNSISEKVEQEHVAVILDGNYLGWSDALQHALAQPGSA